MSEFIVWWEDSDAMKWMVETYARVADTYLRESQSFEVWK